MDYKSVIVEIENHIATITLNNPTKLNAMGEDFWNECREVFENIHDDPNVRVAIIASTGKHFSAGIDLMYLQSLIPPQDVDPARAMDVMRRKIKYLQGAFEAIDKCRVPVLAAIQGGCFGAGIDFISACDIRYASQDAFFTIQEINIGMVADVGTLQRMPRQIPDGLMRELAYTGRKMKADEAQQVGYLTHISDDHESLLSHVRSIAEEIASKSPLAISGSKEMINHTRDHSLNDGLDYIASWNAGMLSFQDVMKGAAAALSKGKAEFDDLI